MFFVVFFRVRRKNSTSFRSALMSGFKVRTLANWRPRLAAGVVSGVSSQPPWPRPKAEVRGASAHGCPPTWQDHRRPFHFLQKLPTAAGPPWTKPHSLLSPGDFLLSALI